MKKRVTIDSHLDKKIKNQVTYLDLLQSVLQFGIQLTEGRKKKKTWMSRETVEQKNNADLVGSTDNHCIVFAEQHNKPPKPL